jgi:SAM-dependent methyltransferase
MKWLLKSKIQGIVAMLPDTFSYEVYYLIQRYFGGLRYVNPRGKLESAIELWDLIVENNRTPSGKVFFEIGTGRMPIMPLAYWLMGAEKVVTLDLNPYLREALFMKALAYISKNKTQIETLFGERLDKDRYDLLLLEIERNRMVAQDYLALCCIEYLAPADAAKTSIPSKSIDFHTSYAVFEHIDGLKLKSILKEALRILKPGGVCVHKIDYSDHFSHSDKTISGINFLQYDDIVWSKYANNRYMYMNRLLHDDYLELFDESGLKPLDVRTEVDKGLAAVLDNPSFILDKKFSEKSRETILIQESWVLGESKALN